MSPAATGLDNDSHSPRNNPAKQEKSKTRAAAGQVTPAAVDTSLRPCYLLPLRWENHKSELAELTGYLRQLSARCDVLVVDGSPPLVFADHHRHWAAFTSHIFPASDVAYRNGKVNGVITGMRATTAERVLIADDDVRYDDQSLARTLTLLADADIVVPQNYFDPLPWHAAWDSARILLNRGLGMDYPGTLAVRRTAFMAAGCYDGDVLFENLELMRTLRADGSRLVTAPDAFVRRLPPDFRHFSGQRVRQAYDSLAQPPRAGRRAGAVTGGRARRRDQKQLVAGRGGCHGGGPGGDGPATARWNSGVFPVPSAAGPALAGRAGSLQLACPGLPAARRYLLPGSAATPRRHLRQVRLVIVDDLEIGEQAGARICTIDQGVQQQRVAREAEIQQLGQNARLIDTLAGEDTPTKDQLRNVSGDRRSRFCSVSSGKLR